MVSRLFLVLTAALPAIARAQTTLANGDALAATMTASVLRMIASLGVVLALLVATAWAVRRWRERHAATGQSIEVISGLNLGAKERIVLLRVGTEQVLVGVSPAGMRSLHVIKDGGRTFDLSMGSSE
jgi:flagellar protein FliO/FliZ